MSTSEVNMAESGQQPPAPRILSATQPFFWSIRRELWEYRSIYVAPLIVAGLIIISFVIAAPSHIRHAAAAGPMRLHETLVTPYNFAALALMGIVFLVSIFYCIEALQGERRDRSLLFWKSLPLSDSTVVLSKMCVPVIILPVIAVVLTIIAHTVMLLLNAVMLKATGVGAGALGTDLSLTQMWMMMLYHMLVLHGLWMAPLYAWLLLVSAWAKRAAFLWAVLPFVAVGVIEKLAFNTAHFGHWLLNRLGGAPASDAYPGNAMAMHEWMHLSMGQVLLNPSLWTGLVAAAVFLLLAARVRRNRGPI